MPERNKQEMRELFCEIGRRMYENELLAATDGNLSAKLSDEKLIFTPGGSALGHMEPEDLVITDFEGKVLEGDKEVTSEYRLHLTCYEERDDIEAVVHAHPPYTLALTLAGISLARPILPEVVFNLGSIPTAPYATPSSPQGPEVIRELVRVHDAMAIDRHGAVTVGETLEDAYLKLEKVEHASKIHHLARQLGVIKVLPKKEVEKLKNVGAEAGLNPEAVLPDPSWDLPGNLDDTEG